MYIQHNLMIITGIWMPVKREIVIKIDTDIKIQIVGRDPKGREGAIKGVAIK